MKAARIVLALLSILLASAAFLGIRRLLFPEEERNEQEPHGANEIFERIAKTNRWGDKESISGDGSSLANTDAFRTCLGTWLVKYGIRSLVDIPCGDANWQAAVPGIGSKASADAPSVPKIKYRGFDISRTAVDRARRKNPEKRTGMIFDVLDLSVTVPPISDAIMVRDAIQHLPLEMGMTMLLHAKLGGARFLIVSSYDFGRNKGTFLGGYYENNVHAPPFSMPPAIETCPNYDRISKDCSFKHAECLSAMHMVNLTMWKPSESHLAKHIKRTNRSKIRLSY